MKELITTFLPRLLAETPSFHKKLRNYSAIAAVIVTAILKANQEGLLIIDQSYINILIFVDVILATIVMTAQTAKKDEPVKKEEENEKIT